MQYFKEQVRYFPVAYSMSRYNTKSATMHNRFGRVWEILDPLFQLGVFYLLFGVLMKRVIPEEYPVLPWMFIGLGVWGLMQKTIVSGALTTYNQLRAASVMKFPVSILPTSAFFGFLSEFWIMLIVGTLGAAFNGFLPSLYLLQGFYYFIALLIFSVSFSLLNATIMIVFPDLKFFLNYSFRFLMFLSGAVFSMRQFSQIPQFILQGIMLNPFYYLIEGFRDAIFGTQWFWEVDPSIILFFWTLTFFILILGTHLHYKIRERISDFL